MRKKRLLLAFLCCMVCACIATGVSALAFAEDSAGGGTYTKVAFAEIEGSSWANPSNLSAAIDGNKGTTANIGEWGQTAFYQTDTSVILAFDTNKTIDRLVITYLQTLTVHTQAWKVEVSTDKEKWGLVTLKANNDVNIMNTAVTNKDRSKVDITIDFEPVECKYVRLTAVIKETWGDNLVCGVNEVEAFTSGAAAKPVVINKQTQYTPSANGGISDGTVDKLNDGQNKYYGAGSGNLLLWEGATVNFTLSAPIKPSLVRVYPNGWEITHDSAGAPVKPFNEDKTINEAALINTKIAKGLKFEGKVNGEWTVLGSFTDIQPYIFAQDYVINTDNEVTEMRMVVTGWDADTHVTDYGEIEIFGKFEGADITVKQMPAKTEYIEGEDFDAAGMKIALNINGSESLEADVTANMVSGYDKTKAGEQTLTVTYLHNGVELKNTFKVTVRPEYSLSIKSEPLKKQYSEGEALNITGLSAALIHNTRDDSGITAEETDITVSEDMLDGYNPQKVGTQTVTVTYAVENYKDVTATFTVKVDFAAVQGTAVNFASAEVSRPREGGVDYYITDGNGRELIDGNKTSEKILGGWGHDQHYNFYEPVTLTVADSSLLGGKAVVDFVRVYLKTSTERTARFMVEVSLDKENWATVQYKQTEGSVIENNAVGAAADSVKTYVNVKFEPVYAKYVRVTYLQKDKAGSLLGQLAEIEAYATEGATVTAEPVYAKNQAYTYTVSSPHSENKDGAANDNDVLYFGQYAVNVADSVSLFGAEPEQAAITFTLNDFIKADHIRLFPNGYEQDIQGKNIRNNTFAKHIKIEGSCDKENWVTLGEYNNIVPYAFAQNFVLDSDYTVKYVKLSVIEANAKNLTQFSEIRIYGVTEENFAYAEESSVAFKTGKKVYSLGEELDLSDLTVTVTDNAGGISVKTVAVTAEMVKNFSTDESGEKTATIEYNGLTCDYVYAVAQIQSVTISKMPNKTVYFVGEDLDTAGMELTVTYVFGEDNQTGSMVITDLTGFVTLDTSAPNNAAKLTVEYYGKTVAADVVVRNVQTLTVVSENHKVSYYIGAKLDVTNLKVKAVYSDGYEEIIDVTADMVSGFTGSAVKAELPLTITYKNATAVYNVEIKALPNQGGDEKTEDGCGCGSEFGLVDSAFIAALLIGAALIVMKSRKSVNK